MDDAMGQSIDWVSEDLKYIWHPCSQMKDYEQLKPMIIERGQGIYLYDQNGKAYMDIISSWWCNLLGHCNAGINAAIKAQLDSLEHVIFANFSHQPAIRLARELAPLLPAGLTKFHFSDNGSASVECALKLAFQYHYQSGHPEKQRFMCFSDAYHGETIGALSVGAMDLYAEMYRPMLMETIHVPAPDCYRCPYGLQRDTCQTECFEQAETCFEQHGQHTAAMIVEPLLQGAAGMRMYPPAYLTKLRALCDRYDVLLIADEIATGFGRTGSLFAVTQAGISPDIMCLSKGLTGGYLPMSLTITTQVIYDAFYDDYARGKAFLHSHTYSGNPLGCVAALAVLAQLQDGGVLSAAAGRAPYLHQRLEEALGAHRHMGEIRQLGLINAMELVADPATKTPFDSAWRTGYQIYQRALELGLLLRPLGDVLYFNPPLTITESEMDKAINLCRQAITDVIG